MSDPQTNGQSISPSHPALFSAGDGVEERALAPHSQVLACLDDDRSCDLVARHALNIAASLGLPVTFAHVMEIGRGSGLPADPVEWHLRLRRCREQLERLIEEQLAPMPVGRLLLTGSSGKELNGWAHDHAGALLVLAAHSRDSEQITGLGGTAQAVLNSGLASVLLVPPATGGASDVGYRRLLVALDGSRRAESILPVAARVARTSGAELTLVHVIANVDTIEAFQEGADELRGRLRDQNEALAMRYLNGLRIQLGRQGIGARILVESDGDPRRRLRRIAMDRTDLILTTSHGYTGLSDVACGNVTAYLADHAPCPLLIIRPEFRLGDMTQPGNSSDRMTAYELSH